MKDSLVFSHVRAPTQHQSDAPPTLLDSIFLTKDDSDISGFQLDDSLGLSFKSAGDYVLPNITQ